MRGKKSKEDHENPLKELDNIKVKNFKELETMDLKDLDLEQFKKSRLTEFKEKELQSFKNHVDDIKTRNNIENLKLEQKSDETCKKILEDLDSIGINGRMSLELLKKIKKGYI